MAANNFMNYIFEEDFYFIGFLIESPTKHKIKFK